MSRSKRNVVKIFNNNTEENISIVIPAAGLATRMTSHGAQSLIRLTKKTRLIDYQLSLLRKRFKGSEIIVVAGFDSRRLMNYLDNEITVENEHYTDTNVVRSIGMGLRACTNQRVLIVYGDLFFTKEYLMCECDCPTLFLSKDMPNREIGCIVNNGQIVENTCYGLSNKWAQILYLEGKELSLFKRYCFDEMNYKCLGFEAINHVIEQGGKFKTFRPNKGFCVDIDTNKDLKRIRDYHNESNS